MADCTRTSQEISEEDLRKAMREKELRKICSDLLDAGLILSRCRNWRVMPRRFRRLSTIGAVNRRSAMPCKVCRFLGKKEVNVHWKVEEFHRELKQLTGVESCQCRKGRFKEIMKASKLRLTQDKVLRGISQKPRSYN